MILTHLPILQVAIPLLSAPLCLLLPRGRPSWLLAFIISGVSLAISITLLQQVLRYGTLSYALGGWPPPWGIEYRIDVANAAMLVIVAFIATVVAGFARMSVEREIGHAQSRLFYTAYLLCVTGLLGIAATGDVFNLFVFLEIASLSSYALIALGRDRRALAAAFQYLIMGTIGATFILIGIALMYMMTGTLNMVDLAARLPGVAHTRTIHAALAFLTVGISLKLALFPLHLWLPDAYTYAPSAVTALLGSTATKVALYILLRFFFTIFGKTYSFETVRVGAILLPLSLAAMIAASLVAVFQDNVKRILAYSSIAQIGYMTLGLSLATTTGVTAGILHLFNHALIKGGLFLSLGCVVYRTGSARIDRFAGLGRRMPWTMAAFVVGALSLIGMPLTAGFISKWYLVLAVLERGWWPLAGLIVLTSLIAVVYLWRVLEVAYFRPAPVTAEDVREAPLALLVPTWVLSAASVYFGVDAALSAGIAHRAAGVLLSPGP